MVRSRQEEQQELEASAQDSNSQKAMAETVARTTYAEPMAEDSVVITIGEEDVL